MDQSIIAYQSNKSELLFLAANALLFHDGKLVPEWMLPLRRRTIVAKWTIKLKQKTYIPQTEEDLKLAEYESRHEL